MANIDLDLVQVLGSCSTHPEHSDMPFANTGGDDFDPNTFAKVFSHIRDVWTKDEEEKIKKVLAGYCIEPEIKHTADCECQAEYNESCSLSFMSAPKS